MSTTRNRSLVMALGLCAALAAMIATPASGRSRDTADPLRGSPQEIAQIQAILVHAGYLAPGDYRKGENDASTRAALQSFQSHHGLPPTGSVDSETMTQLTSHAGASGSAERVVLKGVTFDSGTAILTPESRATLDRIARSLNERPGTRLQVNGYTDSVNTDDVNLRLSRARASAVRQYLVSRGVAASRLEEKGFGESDPIADNATADGRAANRRVELVRID